MVTPEEWKGIEEKLKSFYYTVKLKCDGYEVALMLKRIGQFKNAILVYVNGKVEGKWLMEECEESRRFYRKVTRSAMSQKQKKALAKLPKRLQKELALQNVKFSYYCEYWTSFNSLKRQLVRENKSIELLSDE